MIKHAFTFVLASVALVAGAQACELGQHPAVHTSQAARGIDPSTFIVGHPAGGQAGRSRANGEHPAVRTARSSAAARLDPNAYLVQPPAAVRWTAGPDGGATALAQNAAR